ncbi:MAG: ABC transporter permease [Clostridia bacterium]|nr:ABC transporter permease [Clostridia bacterium]
MFAIYKRELRSYFISPIGYIFVAAFLCVSGIIFTTTTIQAGEASSVGSYFSLLLMVFVIVLPLLTMKLFSDERRLRTEPLLLSSPVSLMGMVMAKFLAAYTVFAGTFLFSCLDFIALYIHGTPNTAIIFGNVIAILLVGGACIAIGVFVSSLTENQFIAAIITMLILIAFVFTTVFNSFIDVYFIRAILSWISLFDRFNNFAYGYFDFNALLYYISLSFVFLFLTVRVYEKRRWS